MKIVLDTNIIIKSQHRLLHGPAVRLLEVYMSMQPTTLEERFGAQDSRGYMPANLGVDAEFVAVTIMGELSDIRVDELYRISNCLRDCL
jgi:hypothetical protein